MPSPQEQESQIVLPHEPAYAAEFPNFEDDNQAQEDPNHHLSDLIDESQRDPYQPQAPDNVFEPEEDGEDQPEDPNNDEPLHPSLHNPKACATMQESAEQNQPSSDNTSEDSLEQDSIGTHVSETQFVGLEFETQQDSIQSVDASAIQNSAVSQPREQPYNEHRTLSDSQEKLRQMQMHTLGKSTGAIGKGTPGERAEDVVDTHNFTWFKASRTPATQGYHTGRKIQSYNQVRHASSDPLPQNISGISGLVAAAKGDSHVPIDNSSLDQPHVLRPRDINMHSKPSGRDILANQTLDDQSSKQASARIKHATHRDDKNLHEEPVQISPKDIYAGVPGSPVEDKKRSRKKKRMQPCNPLENADNSITKNSRPLPKDLTTPSQPLGDRDTAIQPGPQKAIPTTRPQLPTPGKTPNSIKTHSRSLVKDLPFPILKRSSENNTHIGGTTNKPNARKSLADRKMRSSKSIVERSEAPVLEKDTNNMHGSTSIQESPQPNSTSDLNIDQHGVTEPVAPEQEHPNDVGFVHDTNKDTLVSEGKGRYDIPLQAEGSQTHGYENQPEDETVRPSKAPIFLPNTVPGVNIQSEYDHELESDGIVGDSDSQLELPSDQLATEYQDMSSDSMIPGSGENSKGTTFGCETRNCDAAQHGIAEAGRQVSQTPKEGNAILRNHPRSPYQNSLQTVPRSQSQRVDVRGQTNRPLTANQLGSGASQPSGSGSGFKSSSRVQKRKSKALEVVCKLFDEQSTNLRLFQEVFEHDKERQDIISFELKQALKVNRDANTRLKLKVRICLKKMAQLKRRMKEKAKAFSDSYSEQNEYIERIKLEMGTVKKQAATMKKAVEDSDIKRMELCQNMEQKRDRLSKTVKAGLQQANREVNLEKAANQALKSDLEKIVHELGKEKEKSQRLKEELEKQEAQYKGAADLLTSNREALLKDFTKDDGIFACLLKSGIASKTKIEELLALAKNLRIPEGISPSTLTAQLEDIVTRIQAQLQANVIEDVETRKQFSETLHKVEKDVQELSSGLKEQNRLKESIEELGQAKSFLEDVIKAREAELQHTKNEFEKQSEVLAGYISRENEQSEKMQKLEEDLALLQNDPRLASEHETRLQDLERSNDSLFEQLNTANKECSELIDQISVIQESPTVPNQEVEDLRKELEETKNKIEQYALKEEQQGNALEQAVKKAVKEACAKVSEAGNAQLDDIKLDSDVKIKNLRQIVKRLTQEKREAVKNLGKVETQSSSKDGVIWQLRSEVVGNQEERDKLNGQILELRKEIDRQVMRIGECQRQHQVSEDELRKIKQAQQEHAQFSLTIKEQGEKQWREFSKELKLKDALEKDLLLASEKYNGFEEKTKQWQQSVEAHLLRYGIIKGTQTIDDFLQSPPPQDIFTQTTHANSQPESFGTASYDPSTAESQIVSANSTRPRQSKPVTRSASLIAQATSSEMTQQGEEMPPPPRPERRVAARRVSDTSHIQQSPPSYQKDQTLEKTPSQAPVLPNANRSEYFSKDGERSPISANIGVSPRNSVQKPSRTTANAVQLKSALRKPSSGRSSDMAAAHRNVEFSATPPEQGSPRTSQNQNTVARDLQSQNGTARANNLLARPMYNRPVSGASTSQFVKELHSSTATHQQEFSRKLSPPMPLPKHNKRAGSGGGKLEQEGSSKKPRVSISALKPSKRTSRVEIPDSQDVRLN